MAAPIFVGTAAASIYTNPLSGAVGTGADIVVGIARTQTGGTATAISATYASVSMTSVAQRNFQADLRRVALFGLTSPATGTQSYSVTSADTVRGLGFGSYSTVNTGDPYGTPAENSGNSTGPSLTVNASTNDVVLIALSWSGTATLDTPGGTVRVSSSADGHNVRIIEVAGDTTVNWSGTLSGASDWGVVGVALRGTVAGPTINTQPTAQTATISEGGTATFTIAATGTGGLTYDWELESGVGSGTYANVADGSGATWTGQAAATLVGTFTATTLTGRRVRCNVTDSNGTVTSTAVTLTVRAGDAITPTSGTTDGSGVETFAFTSDASVSAQAGTFARVRVTAGGITKTVCLRPGA